MFYARLVGHTDIRYSAEYSASDRYEYPSGHLFLININ